MEESSAALILASLGHEARLRVFRKLIAAGPEGLPAGTLSAALDMPPSTLSHHLGSLEQAGLIIARRDGRHIFYAIQTETVRALLAFLREDCCGGQPALCGLSDIELCQ